MRSYQKKHHLKNITQDEESISTKEHVKRGKYIRGSQIDCSCLHITTRTKYVAIQYYIWYDMRPIESKIVSLIFP